MGRKKDPFWQYVDIVEENKVKCKFCGDKFAGGASRIKGHLSGMKRKGIHVCRDVPSNVRIAAASTYDDYEKEEGSKGETVVMKETNDMDGIGKWIIFPGFRFHPTDRELVGFYLRRKIQKKSLPFEIIKQLDIYKYEPWDLPALATMGEKEWWFYCPINQKYKKDGNPNRVTENGYWKATGVNRVIFSKRECIGVKKCFEYYRGKISKGIKTDWMLQEFRLPPALYLASPATDSWAICKIFQKTSFLHMAEDVLYTVSDIHAQSANDNIEKRIG